MKKKPVLMIMAAGMGSRFGGLKQVEPVDEEGHILMDFSLYDARLAGFEHVIFIIRKEHEALFDQIIGSRTRRVMQTSYAFQTLEDLPAGFALPEGREKPWGTGQAVLSAEHLVDGPFAVINADDYYGREAFRLIFSYLSEHEDDARYRYAMVGYPLKNTLSEAGHVSRGVCVVDPQGYLTDITERTRIIPTKQGAACSEDEGQSWQEMDPEALVSMNLWGFSKSFLRELKAGFPAFLEQGLKENPQKCEYFLPSVVDRLIKEEKATVQVLSTGEKWFGMTYPQDREQVIRMLQRKKEEGIYPWLLT